MDSKKKYELKSKSRSLVVNIIKFLFLAGMCYLFLFPVIYLVVSAIQDPATANDPAIVWIPKHLSLANFKNAIEELNYLGSLGLTMFITVFGVAATLASCSMVGYGFARFKFFEKNIAFMFVIALIIIPPQTTTISTFLNFRFFDLGGIFKLFAKMGIGQGYVKLTGSPVTMIIPALFASGIRAGLAIYIFRQFFLGQPKELEEAAKIDGCSAFGTFVRVMLPLATPAIITVSVLGSVWYWNDSFYTSLFFDATQRPLAAGLDLLRETMSDGNAAAHLGYDTYQVKGMLAAGSLLCIIPIIIFYLIVQRKFTESIERSGIVG